MFFNYSWKEIYDQSLQKKQILTKSINIYV